MTSDRWSIALAELRRRVAEAADASPSLEALYALEPTFVYSDFWQPAREQLMQRCEAAEVRAAWLDELRRTAPDPLTWLGHHRSEATRTALEEAARSWSAQTPERMLAPHHHIPGVLDSVGAVHVALLGDLDPVGAVEYVAALQSEHLIWRAVRRLPLRENDGLIDQVVATSRSRDAVLLCLGCVFDTQRASVGAHINESRWNAGDQRGFDADAALGQMWQTVIPERHRRLADALVRRHDAGAVLAPWIRHLVRNADSAVLSKDDHLPKIARIALENVLAILPALHEV
jgi:hypothetical protein